MSIQDERDANLIVVATVEEYGRRHQMSTKDVIKLFNDHHLVELIRSQYDVLHMLDLGEGASFVEDVLKGGER